MTVTGIYTLLAIAVGTGCASGLPEIGGGFVIVPISYWIIVALDAYPDIAIRTTLWTNLLMILPPAIIGTWAPNKMKEIHEKIAVILEICGLVWASLGAALAARQKGEGTIRNGAQVNISLTSVPSFTDIVGFVAIQQVPYYTV